MPKLPENSRITATAPSPRSIELQRNRHMRSDANRMAFGRAQIAAGAYVEIDDVDVYLASLEHRPSKP